MDLGTTSNSLGQPMANNQSVVSLCETSRSRSERSESLYCTSQTLISNLARPRADNQSSLTACPAGRAGWDILTADECHTRRGVIDTCHRFDIRLVPVACSAHEARPANRKVGSLGNLMIGSSPGPACWNRERALRRSRTSGGGPLPYGASPAPHERHRRLERPRLP